MLPISPCVGVQKIETRGELYVYGSEKWLRDTTRADGSRKLLPSEWLEQQEISLVTPELAGKIDALNIWHAQNCETESP